MTKSIQKSVTSNSSSNDSGTSVSYFKKTTD